MNCIIKKNDHDEFEVPTARAEGFAVRPDCIYYTDDKDDAISTAQYHYGDDVMITIRRGTYDMGAK